MEGVEPIKLETGIWKCPICGFTAMSRRVVENHIKSSHPEALKEKQHSNSQNHNHGNNRNGKGGKKKQKPQQKQQKKKDWREIMNELYHNYPFELLHNKKAIIYVQWGHEVREFRGLVHARDPYTILLDTEGGERWIISKGHIIAYRPIKE